MTDRCETWIDRYCRMAPICPGRTRHAYEDFGPSRESGYDAEEACSHCGVVRCSNTTKRGWSRGFGWTIVGYLRKPRARAEEAET